MSTATVPAAAGAGTGAPSTLPGRLLERAAREPRRAALRQKELGIWREIGWGEYSRLAARVGLGLRSLGVGPGDKVAIHASNRWEWVATDLGTQGIGAITVGVYPTSPPAEVEYVLDHSGALVLVAEDEEQLDKVLEVRTRLPNLRRIVVIDTRGVRADDEMLMSFADLLARGEQASEREFADLAAALDPSQVATLVYTSGTTGPPKGAMLTHANLAATAHAAASAFDIRPGDEVLSYLPLCHVAERVVSVVDALHFGYVVNFGDGPDALAADLHAVQPTFFLGVPRVWEKMLAGVELRIADTSRLKRAVHGWAERGGAAVAQRRMASGRVAGLDRLRAGAYSMLGQRALRRKLGLSRVRIALSGAAPIAPQVLEAFWALGVPVREVYGQTESSGIATVVPEADVRLGTVGTPFPGVEVRVGDLDEILVRGDVVFAGYYRSDEATRATVDADGWLHTGDVGHLDADGHLTITDRMKDIVITAGGKNVSPQYVENLLKVSPFINEAIVVGDGRPYLCALIGIDVDTVGDWCSRRRLDFTTYADLVSKPEVEELVGEWVEQVNHDLASAEQVKRFSLLPKELDPDDGELTPTMKVKRRAIAEEFAGLIEEMYRLR